MTPDPRDLFERAMDEAPWILPVHVLAVVNREKVTRLDVARAYSLLISGGRPEQRRVAELNEAIMQRWSVAGLQFIKKEAWAIAEGKR